LPYLTEDYYLNFYGGEPLLAFDLIRQVVSFLKTENKKYNKTVHYSLTTNGSLLTDKIIQFLNKHSFSVELSFDGLAQDVGRQKGSRKKIVPIIKELLNHPNIDLEINSVFSPVTVNYLSDSIQFIMNLGVPDIRFSLSTKETWSQIALKKLENEISRLREIVTENYRKESNIQVVNFRDIQRKGIFYCAAGKDRLTIAPDGGVWGCFLFADYFRERENMSEYQKYFYGDLDDFMNNHSEIYPRISSKYAQLSMENFRTSKMECFLCKECKNCAVCPINAALSGAPIGQIPDHICEIKKIVIRGNENFRKL
jgi:sulfatase maturation enzyme AslB (radical SAM superfamily)